MPSFIKRAGRFAKRRYYKGGKLSSSRVMRDVQQLRSLINVERKFLDLQLAPTAIAGSGAGNVVLMNGIAQGADYNQRNGNSIKMNSVHIEGFLTLDASQANDCIKLSLILDRQPNGTIATFGDCYDLTTVPGSIALRNSDTVDRYKVLKTKDVVLSTAGKTKVFFKFLYKFPNHGSKDSMDGHVKYNNTTAAVGSITSNALYFMYCGTLATGATNSGISYSLRLRYIDN